MKTQWRPTKTGSSRAGGEHEGLVWKDSCWHDCDIALCGPQFRLRSLSGRVAETPGGPGLTRRRHQGQHKKPGHPASLSSAPFPASLAGGQEHARTIPLAVILVNRAVGNFGLPTRLSKGGA